MNKCGTAHPPSSAACAKKIYICAATKRLNFLSWSKKKGEIELIFISLRRVSKPNAERNRTGQHRVSGAARTQYIDDKSQQPSSSLLLLSPPDVMDEVVVQEEKDVFFFLL